LFGFSLNPFTWFKKPDSAPAPPAVAPAVAATAPAATAPAAATGKTSLLGKLGSFFGASPETEATKAAAVAPPPPPAAAAVQPLPLEQVGGRKTRHRRRSPRRHRK
jgi:hypothetical protein